MQSLVFPMTVLVLAVLAVPQLSPFEAPVAAHSMEPAPAVSGKASAKVGISGLPLRFERNDGQTNERVRFVSRGRGYALFLTPEEAVIAMQGDASAVVRMSCIGANASEVVGEDELPGRSNYFTGNDPSRWHTDVPAFARVRYRDVYPGIDLVYYEGEGGPEFDFVVAPGVDPAQIAMRFAGASRLEIDTRGDLVVGVSDVELRVCAPVLYQESGTGRELVPGSFMMAGDDAVGFDLGEYDPSLPLVIDPVIVTSTFLGGSVQEIPNDIHVDSTGAVYLVGYTRSTDFPVVNGYDSTLGGTRDAFVMKLNPSGNAIVFSTYLGANSDTGDEFDQGTSIAVDAAGSTYVVGVTPSATFPVVSAYDATHNGGNDAFVTKLGVAGNTIVYSTFLGGGGEDRGNAISVDATGAAYLTGSTASTNFPTSNGFDMSHNGASDAFVTKLNPDGSTLGYSTYLGSVSFDVGNDVAVNTAGDAYVVGSAQGANFPTLNAYDPTHNGNSDAFVTRLSAGGSTLVFSTFIGGGMPVPGGGASDACNGVALDASGAAYLTGSTNSLDFPTVNALDATHDPQSHDGFVAKLAPEGNALAFSTFLGGSGRDSCDGIALAADGTIHLIGSTQATDFPTVNATDATYGGFDDVFVSQMSPSANQLLFSTYLGGANSDRFPAIAAGAEGKIWACGETFSPDFPLVDPLDSTMRGTTALFLTCFGGFSTSGGSDTPGIYLGSSGSWFLRNSNSPGAADLVFGYGPSTVTWLPLEGDWDGDGDDTPGLFDPSSSFFFLRNTNSPGGADLVFGFGPGNAGWTPLVGDWDGDGDDTVGLYDTSSGFFFLRNANAPGGADLVFGYGPGGSFVPLAGDWDGDGDDTPGLYDPASSFFFLKNANGPGPADTFFGFGPGGAGWTPLAGDWDGDGDDTPGLYDPGSGFFYLRNQNAPGGADSFFGYGPPGATPLTGDWDNA